MKTAINITSTSQDTDRFSTAEELKAFYQNRRIDGMELMLCGMEKIPSKIDNNDVIGIHLGFFPAWIDFWNGDKVALLHEYGEEEIWIQHFGGNSREALIKKWKMELEIAHLLKVDYVVFHVSECTMEECFTYQFKHTDEEVCEKACEVINMLLDGESYEFYFLVENLWWSGFTMTRPEITKQLLEGIHYIKKGIMLDTGHLLHTKLSLKNQEEGVSYIREILKKNKEFVPWIKGIHLNQSLSGDYVKNVIKSPPQLAETYWERLSQIYPHIFQIDYHKPFTADGVSDLIRQIEPKFLTFELITRNLAEHEEALDIQLKVLYEQGGAG